MIAQSRELGLKKVKSPCIGVCSTGIGDSVCRGCKRFSHEIIHWNAYGEIEKRAVQNRLDTLLTQVVDAKVDIFDPVLLRDQLRKQYISFDPERPASTWVFALLQAGAKQISAFHDFGFSALPAFETLSPPALKQEIDCDFYTLSSVHFERYFQVNA